MKIRKTFVEYLQSKFAFSLTEINKAWEIANKTIYTDYLTLEVMTRDLLTNKKNSLKIIEKYFKENYRCVVK